MIRLIKLSVFPLIGIALLALAWFWSAREFQLRMAGQPTEGRIAGMVVERKDSIDLVSGVDTTLVLTRASGSQITARVHDGDWVSIQEGEKQIPPGEMAQQLGEETTRVLEDAKSINAEVLRWAILRESRRGGDPSRIVRLDRQDKLSGFFGISMVPDVLEVSGNRPQLKNETPGTAEVRAVFDSSDPELLAAKKGDSMVEYSYRINGKDITPNTPNFFLSAEPYSTQFRPVFVYRVDALPIARLSHIGRHGGPTLAMRLHTPCRVYFDPSQPSEAFVAAETGPFEWKDPLGWFSRYCEGLFAQWGSTSLIVIAGLACLTTGLLFISLAVFPSKVGRGGS